MHVSRNYVFLGLSITSSWGNGHATTYRGLVKELAKRGHKITFLERDVPWYAAHREFSKLPYCDINLYSSLDELKERFTGAVRRADAAVVGSYVPEGIAVGRWVLSTAKGIPAFYDIDTPVTLSAIREGNCEYLSRDLIRKYKLYFSFTGGPTLELIEHKFGSPSARALYCSVDPALYFPDKTRKRWDLGYLGTYAADRQPSLDRLLVQVAGRNPERRFIVAGPQYPKELNWPPNIERIEHLPASHHREFYNSQRLTLNVTRRDMIRAGYSPSVRLFEAAACGTAILTDEWPGLRTFFRLGSEILPVRSTEDVTSHIQMAADQRLEMAEKARRRTLRFHTAAVRAEEFERYVDASLHQFGCSKKRSSVVVERSPSAALI
ncbi:MAG: glycosyltransferase [Acidobacteriaceae bacterium]|nr:glycosyltransferase [Acidobacteriaceae bacterium]MBV9500095.1 glycosyltransferase [Acidobacteriaceae bacterium]